MPRSRRFMQLDVFSHRLLLGNPLAVIIDSDGLEDASMQAIARWTNLSETTFLLPPTCEQADYRVRIFTPARELPFAGHPSVGSAYVAMETGLVAADKINLIQECAAGLLPVRVQGADAQRVIHVQAPHARLWPASAGQVTQLGAALRTATDFSAVRFVDNGPIWIICHLHHAAAVRQLHPDMAVIAALCAATHAVGVAVYGRETHGDAAMAVRAFCPADGIAEDPVTGSANAAIMAFVAAQGDPDGYGPSYRASQGREVGRDGYVDVGRDATSGAISIGGACAIGIRGELVFD